MSSSFAAPLTTLEFTQVLRRLARLVQEMGDRGRAFPAAAPAAALRPRYLQLLRQATYLAQEMGIGETEVADYLTARLVAQLRATSRGERRADMSLHEALGYDA